MHNAVCTCFPEKESAPGWDCAWPVQPYMKPGRGEAPGLLRRGMRRIFAWPLRKEAEPESGPGPCASPQTLWALCACQLRSSIFQGARSAGCLAGATPTPAIVSQFQGPSVQKGWGEASFSKGRHSTFPGHMAVPALISPGTTSGQSWEIQSPLAGLFWGEQVLMFPLSPGPFTLPPLSQDCHGFSIWCMCEFSSSSPHFQTPNLLDP